jgi:hypothetical protein
MTQYAAKAHWSHTRFTLAVPDESEGCAPASAGRPQFAYLRSDSILVYLGPQTDIWKDLKCDVEKTNACVLAV